MKKNRESSCNNHMPWREMYKGASTAISPPRRTRSLTHDLHHDHFFSSLNTIENHHLTYPSSDTKPVKSRSFSSSASCLRRHDSAAAMAAEREKKVSFVPAEQGDCDGGGRGARIPSPNNWRRNSGLGAMTENGFHCPMGGGDGGERIPSPNKWRRSSESAAVAMVDKFGCGDVISSSASEEEEEEEQGHWNWDHGKLELALYIAAAQGALAALAMSMYALWLLLDEYRKPILWAILCSMPLREVQRSLLQFWAKPLRDGVLQTVLAIPMALLRALIATLMDARAVLIYLYNGASAAIATPSICTSRNQKQHHHDIGFSTLMQWLASFAFCSLAYESLGPAPLAITAFLGMLSYAASTSLGLLSYNALASLGFIPPPYCSDIPPSSSPVPIKSGGRAARVLRRLHLFTAVLLIFAMISGSISGFLLFSYKVGVESRGAVVALKAHISNQQQQRGNYTGAAAGLRRWMEENKVADMIDNYAGRAYGTVEGLAAQYNLSEAVKAGREYMQRAAVRGGEGDSAAAVAMAMAEALQRVRTKLVQLDFKGLYAELEQVHDEMIGKGKQIGQWWVVEAGKALMAAVVGTVCLMAAGAVKWVMKAAVFFSVLYYFIVSETGGATEQALAVVPMPAAARRRCAAALDQAVVTVLLSTAKAAIFQATFTWLLFRSLGVHFLYVSTLLALLSSLLSLPCCIPAASLLGAAQLAIQGSYVRAALLLGLHGSFVRYGVARIQRGTPRSFAGMTVAVGIVLFWHSPERAILGPVIISLLVALKNLCFEFTSEARDSRAA